MSNTSEQPAEVKGLAEEGDEVVWAPKDEIAIRMDDHKSAEATRRQREAAHRARMRVVGVVVAFALGVAGYLTWRYRHAVTDIPPKPLPHEEMAVQVSQPSDFIDYLLTRGSVKAGGQAYELRRFEFDSNRFLSGNATLDNASKFRATLGSDAVRGELNDSWVIIFAGASFDGKPETNQQLCRERVVTVANIIRQQGLSPRRLWGIPAGEKIPNLSSPISEEDEERVAAEQELRGQRALIIVAVRPTAPDDAQNSQDVMRRLSTPLYKSGLLPSDYDAREAEPAPLNLPPSQ
jgi:outer membrane protein OmpA-like peptidoglycan-associated protein